MSHRNLTQPLHHVMRITKSYECNSVETWLVRSMFVSKPSPSFALSSILWPCAKRISILLNYFFNIFSLFQKVMKYFSSFLWKLTDASYLFALYNLVPSLDHFYRKIFLFNETTYLSNIFKSLQIFLNDAIFATWPICFSLNHVLRILSISILRHFSCNHCLTSCRMLFGNLPTELIIHNLQFLSFEDIENLAWTNRRIMKIVQRNLPEALHPKIKVRFLTINQPPKFVMSMFGFGPIDELPEAKV